ncbi:MAG: hypothetical protein V5B38_04150 [Candidatus Accumulibacter propinquus]
MIAGRLRSRQNGAAWQLAHYAKHRDFFRLTADYLEHQRRLVPVHEWPYERFPFMLTVLDTLPEHFLDTPARELHRLLPGPTLIHLPGRRQPPLFVSVLLHGNEDSGVVALQSVLRHTPVGRCRGPCRSWSAM